MAKRLTTKDCLKFVCDGLDTINDSIKKQRLEPAEQNRINKERLEFEKETKDRVDISLKEYEQLKRELRDTHSSLEKYKEIFGMLKLNEYIDYIDPNSMTVSTLKDLARISTRVLIQFECKTMIEFPFERKERE